MDPDTKAQRRSLETLNRSGQALQDAQDLADLAHCPELSRKFSIWSVFFLAFSVLAPGPLLHRISTAVLQTVTQSPSSGGLALVIVASLVACPRDAILPTFVGICFVALFVTFSLSLRISVGVKDDFTLPARLLRLWPLDQPGRLEQRVTWFIGLVQAAYRLTTFDSAIHMVEEIPAPRKKVPRVIWLSVALDGDTVHLHDSSAPRTSLRFSTHPAAGTLSTSCCR